MGERALMVLNFTLAGILINGAGFYFFIGAFLYSYAPGVAVNRFGGGTNILLPTSAGQ